VASSKTLIARILPRVSDEADRGEKLTSIKSQIRDGIRVLNSLKLPEGQTIEVDVESSERYSDIDQSGFLKHWRKRPGLAQHLKDASEGKFQVIAFWKIDRISRRVKWSIEIVEEFQKFGVKVVGIEDSIDLDSSQGRFMFNVMASCAEQEAENISTRVKASKRFRREEGKRSGGKLPLWLTYEKSSEGNKIVYWPYGREMALKMVNLRLGGMGYQGIAKTLNDAGYRNRRGGLWLQGDVQRFFGEQNLERMKGHAIHKKKDRNGKLTKEWEVVKNTHPPLMDFERIDALRITQESSQAAYRDMTSQLSTETKYRADSPFLVSGIAFCAECGARLTSGQQSLSLGMVDPRYYVCSNAKFSRSTHQKSIFINAGQIEDAVVRVLRHILAHPGYEKPPQPKKELLKTRLREDVLAEMESVTDQWLKKILPYEIYNKIMERLNKELAEIDSISRQEITPIAHTQVVEILQSDAMDKMFWRQIVHLLIERVEGPIYQDQIMTATNSRGVNSNRRNRKCVQVTTKLSDIDGHRFFLAPLYPYNSRVERELFVFEGADSNYAMKCIPRWLNADKPIVKIFDALHQEHLAPKLKDQS